MSEVWGTVYQLERDRATGNDPDSLRAENERLRKGISNYLSGDYGPRVKKTETCEHGQYGYEVCEACIDAHFTKLLNPTS